MSSKRNGCRRSLTHSQYFAVTLSWTAQRHAPRYKTKFLYSSNIINVCCVWWAYVSTEHNETLSKHLNTSPVETDSRPFRSFNYRRGTRQRSTASKLQIIHGMARRLHDAIIQCKASFVIHRITSAKRRREVQPAVLIRESTCVALGFKSIHWIHASDTYRFSRAPWIKALNFE